MTTISNFPEDLVLEILSRVPFTSLSKVRCTCKTWNALSKIHIFGKETSARKHVLGFTVLGSRVCTLRFDLQGILNDGDLVDPSIKQISKLDQVTISQVLHSDGLLLCVAIEEKRKLKLMVWNPYLGQKRWIPRPNKVLDPGDMLFVFGYDNNNKNRNHKILRIFEEFVNDKGDSETHISCLELYDLNSNSWRVLDLKPYFYIYSDQCITSLKGNTYFVAQAVSTQDAGEKRFLLCFDFTTESFGPRLPLPFHSEGDVLTLSCVREEKEQLAVLCQHDEKEELEIWITTKVLPNAVSWSKFLKVEITPLNGFMDEFAYGFDYGSFFIDEEKKVAVVFYEYYECEYDPAKKNKQGAYIIGENRNFNFVDLGEAWKPVVYKPPVFSSYVPSLVQVEFNQRGKRKLKDCS